MRELLTTTALLLLCGFASAQAVPCDSFGSYRECRIASHGHVLLVMEVSVRACFEGLSWGTASDGVVWVDRGCQARFKTDVDPSSLSSRGKRIVCESLDGRLKTCEADGIRGVALAQQLSRSDCVKDKDWGYSVERGQLWVDHGCRAAFGFGKFQGPAQPMGSLNLTVTCESADGRRRECAADTSAGVQIVRELDEKRCAYDRDWGVDTRKKTIWVTRGCRAEFAVRGKPTVSLVVCESQGDARVHCAATTELGVALVKVLGESRCVLGTTWDFDDVGVWVSGGCRAQFALGGFRLEESAAPKSAARIVCESALGSRSVCEIDTARGVGLLRQLSESPCILNRTWGYGAGGIWVSDGCRAEFAVAR